MSDKLEYTVKVDGWVAGQRCKAGSIIMLTKAQARYENVTLKSDQDKEPAKPALIGVDLASGPDQSVETVMKPATRKKARATK